MPVSACSKAHQPAYRESFLPPRPLAFPWAAMAARRSKKSKMMVLRASESELMGIKVEKASRAKPESARSVRQAV